MIAQESEDPDQALTAIKDIIKSCTFDQVDVDSLATYDLEYLFLQLRSKSVGEIVDLQSKCSQCESFNQVQVDLEKLEIQRSDESIEDKIQLDDSVGITLRSIPVKELKGLSNKTEDFTKIVSLYIESIYDDANVYYAKDCSTSELEQFVDSLSHKQLMMIEKFISSQPKVVYKGNFVCHSCQHKNTFTLEGMQDFFE
jgi:hypothetical protein